jgi:hypothetical protein
MRRKRRLLRSSRRMRSSTVLIYAYILAMDLYIGIPHSTIPWRMSKLLEMTGAWRPNVVQETRYNLLLDFCITLLPFYYLTRYPLGKPGVSTERDS